MLPGELQSVLLIIGQVDDCGVFILLANELRRVIVRIG